MTKTRLLTITTAIALAAASLSVQGGHAAPSAVSASTAMARPAYDTAVVRQVGRRLGDEYATHVTEHFALVHLGDEAWAQQTGRLLEKAHREFFETFSEAGFKLRPVDERMIWVCFPDRDEFTDYALDADHLDMSWSQGYYSARTNLVAVIRSEQPLVAQAEPSEATDGSTAAMVHPVNETERPVYRSMDAARATHEAAHQLAFNTGLKTRGVMYPLWTSEGLATNFEIDAAGNIELGASNSFRLRTLLAAYRQDRLMPLDQFITLCRVTPDAHRSISDLYAQCWGFFAFLMQEHRAELVQYMQRVAAMETGYREEWRMRQEFVAAFGPVRQMEQRWQEHLASLDKSN